MKALDLFLLDYQECRRRFLMVAASFPNELLTWRPDISAFSVGETIRHVLLHDLSWLKILKEKRLPTDEELIHLLDRPYTDLQDEIDRSIQYQKEFIDLIKTYNEEELLSICISWPHKPIKRTLGDTLERKSYHDAVHTGQLLQYLRMLNIERPMIWD
jgi:uncharacterized damage-inducible protein DinB